jgi:precorrin-6A/cobalt-precorrin-6A reductase
MILLLGGTAETASLASALVSAGFRVLVSTATDVPLDIGSHPNISRRSGKLDATGMKQLVQERKATAIVDATHPYAAQVRTTARKVASELNLPYFRWRRASALHESDVVTQEPDHQRAAKAAFTFGKPVLLTTGSGNLKPYVNKARKTNVLLVARVLSHPTSIEACRAVGLSDENIVTGRGPFSVEENLDLIERFNIGVIVTKDSGRAGGAPEKIEAARLAGCRVVVVQRPEESPGPAFDRVEDLVDALLAVVSPST